MTKLVLVYSFLLFQIINAQANDITSLIFTWIDEPNNFGEVGVQVSQNFQSNNLIRWNDDKTEYNYPIYLYTFYTDTIPSNLIGHEDDINSLLLNAVSSWNDNYNIQIEIDDYADKAVHAYFYDDSELFEVPGGGYAQAITKIPVLWNSSKEQFETFEQMEESETLTDYYGINMIFFYNNSNAPTWTTSTTPDNGKAMLGTVMLHEMGHVLSMGHNMSDSPTRIMNSPYNSATITASLTSGDISNASYHYSQLYENTSEDYLYNEGLVEFIPQPNVYGEDQEIFMVLESDHITRNNIWYNYNKTTDPNSEYLEPPDVTADYCVNRAWSGWDPYKRILRSPGYWYYYKAAVWNDSSKQFEGQTEGIYYCDRSVGVEDDIILMPGIIVNGQLVETIYEPNTHYYNYSGYTLNFIDTNPVSGDPDYIVSWDNWKCYVNNGCEDILIMDSQSFYIPTLPNGYNWERDANNNVIARMEKSGTDNDGIHHSTSAQIKISNAPNNFVTSGTIPVNTTWCGDITITGDITIPVGKQLTVSLNSHITFTNGSSLIVEGNLVFESHDFRMSVLDFQSQNSTLKNGVKINPDGSANINNAIIKNAYNGVYVNEGVVNIDNSEIFDCYYGVHLYRTNYASPSYSSYIENIHSHDNEFGVVMYYSNAHLSNNEFNNNWIGVGCADYSSPYLAENDGNSESIGQNNIHNNDIAVFAYGYSNPRLGRVNCTSDGGKNIITNNNDYDFFTHSNCNIYAEGNYWGGGAPVRYVGGGCSFDYTPYLTSQPQMSQTSGNSPEEEIFDIQFNQQQSNSNNSTDVLELTSSDKPKGFDEKWSIEWKLLYARNLINVKKYNSASAICEDVINNYPDSSLSYLALDLLHQARVSGSSKSLFSQFVKEKANKKVKKQIYGAAELLLAGGEKKDRVAVLDGIAKRYKNTPLIEFVLFQKFMYYLYEENNLEMAKSTSEELEKLFPKSESYFDSQRHLGNDVKRTLEPQLKKSNSNEESFEVPKTYELLGNYPNPFNPSTTVKYALPHSSNVELTIYDITGKVVKVFEETIQSAGYQNIVWHGNNQHGSRVSSGVYFYRFKASSLEGDGKSFEKTAKMLLLK